MARTKKRPSPVSYRPPIGRGDELAARVASSGLTLNAFITAAIFDGAPPRAAPRRGAIDPKMAARLLAQAAQITTRLDTFAKCTAEPGQQALLEECRRELAEIRTCLLLTAGRQP